jgi:2-dehydro-3-deoxyphosphogluconate aldolase/(4S)-4-hydroxy-2-oxoglutarate aldolase
MKKKKTILKSIIDDGIVAIIRQRSDDHVLKIADALASGGIRAIEITADTPNVYKLLKELSKRKDILPGIGSVADEKTVKKAVDAGAQFIVTPFSLKKVIKEANKLSKPVFSGAFTPGEIDQAYRWGADVVKWFPADAGIHFFKALRAPMPYVPFMPTGGVSLENAADWIRSGASCLGVGSALTDKQTIAEEDWDQIRDSAAKFLDIVHQTREEIA